MVKGEGNMHLNPKPLNRSSLTELKNAEGAGLSIEYHGIRIQIDKMLTIPGTLPTCVFL
jgi:hypothetical protein